jgi:peptidyl-prolyl cis-trans isomerase A (cyclophilin A)
MPRFLIVLTLAATTSLSAQGTIPITIETSLGPIEAELDSVHAPVTVTNFLRYLDAHLLDQSEFFRTVTMANQPDNAVKIEVIQSHAPAVTRAREFPPIPLEPTSVTGLKHHDGSLSMARSGPNTATDQFFITIGEQPELDFGGKRNADGQGFAAFGWVTKGMDVVQKIQTGAANGQNLVAPVAILRVVRRK